MKFRNHLFLFLLGLLFAGHALGKCDALTWKFGMSPEEVMGITECGPYKSFSNGDLETFKGVFDSKEENFQFFFENRKLRRIGIYLYEGNDPAAGARKWRTLYSTLSRLYGRIESPDNLPPLTGDADVVAFESKAKELVQSSGKVQMAPLAQPDGASVFSNFWRREATGQTFYFVVLYFDKRQ